VRKWLATLAVRRESRSFSPISLLVYGVTAPQILASHLVSHGAGSAPSSRLELRKKASRICIVIFATVH
jgi:hypothetical protein